METHHSQIGKGVALPDGMVLGQYRLLHKIGQGGFGITYLAEHMQSSEQVVIKENLPTFYAYRDHNTLQVHPLDDAGSAENYARTLQRFVEEARLLAYLNHPNIVQVNEAFEALGTAYYVMPYIPGKELHKAAPAEVDEAWLLPILKAVLSALGYLHSQNLLHRDMKPGNILLQEDGTPILIDFGTARALQTERSATMIGTPGYTPIEQITVHGNRGPWTDIYALGATCYRLITGERPPEAFNRVEEVDPYRPLAYRDELQGRFSPAMLHSIDTALAVRAKDRWQSAEEWLEALENPTNISLATSSPAINISVIASSAVSAEAQAVLSAPPRRKSHGLGIAALATAALVLGGGYAVYSYLNTAKQQRAQAELGLAEAQRLTREHEEQITREKAEREKVERLAQERATQEEEERIFREQVEKEEEERLAQEKAAREEAERLVQEKKLAEDARGKLEAMGIIDYDAEILHAYNKPETLKYLIAVGANVNKVAENGETALLKAVNANSIECVKLLLSAPGIDVNKGSYEDIGNWSSCVFESPLECAIQRGHTECVKLLLTAPGIDLNQNNGSLLLWALENNKMEYVKRLLEVPGVDLNGNISSLLSWASENNKMEYVKQLLATPGINVSMDAFFEAATNYELPECLKLLQTVPNIEASGWNPLSIAVLKDDIDGLKKLIKSGAELNQNDEKGGTPLTFATQFNRIECVKLLLSAPGIDVNKADKSGETPLYTASKNGHTECVKLLLAAPGIDVNKADKSGETPLYTASKNGHTECVKLLLTVPGIDVNKTNSHGATPIYLAVTNNHTKCVKLLLTASKIDVNKADEEGRTPLLKAVIEGYTECVKLLLTASKIDVNKVDKEGNTPLHHAASGKPECVKLLLAVRGINVNKVSKPTWSWERPKTPLDEAEHHPECAKLIRAAGGRKAK